MLSPNSVVAVVADAVAAVIVYQLRILKDFSSPLFFVLLLTSSEKKKTIRVFLLHFNDKQNAFLCQILKITREKKENFLVFCRKNFSN